MNHLRPTLMLACMSLGLTLTACGNRSLDDARFPTGSQTITASSDYSRVYVANVDAGTVSVMTAEGEVLTKVDVGAEPTRIARVGERILVTLKGERAVAVLQEVPEGLESVGYIEVGAEPVGVVGSERGTVAYVAVSAADIVVEVNVDDLTITRSWSVPDQPSFLALHPSDDALYAGSAMNGTLSYINLRRNNSVKQLELPELERQNNCFSEECAEKFPDGTVVMNVRITGDLAVSPNGKSLAVPALFLDNSTPVDDPDGDSIESGGGYASTGGGVGRFNPGVITIPTGSGGDPGIEDSSVVFAAGSDIQHQDRRSYVNSVTFSPDNMTMLASMEGSDAVIVIPRNVSSRQRRGQATFDFRENDTISTGAGPRGVVFLEEKQAFIHNFLDNSVADSNYEVAFDRLVDRLGSGKGNSASTMDDFSRESGEDMASRSVKALPAVMVEDETLSAEIAEGRRLFFSATDERVTSNNGGVSCATCHMGARNDGITWNFVDGKQRQTPSLAGDLSFMDRVTWTDNVPSVAAEARLTSMGRMGGTGLSISESRSIESFVNYTQYPDAPLVGSTDEGIARGKTIFEREDVGCATCHTGEHMTDQEPYDMFGITAVRTPGLKGLALTAPYLHDGRAATLEDMLVLSSAKQMGDTSMLSDAEIADLVLYLKSL